MATSNRKRSISVTVNDDYTITTEAICSSGTVTVEGTGTVTLGYADSGGSFVAYTDGLVTSGGKTFGYGLGNHLIFNLAGVSGTVIVEYTPIC